MMSKVRRHTKYPLMSSVLQQEQEEGIQIPRNNKQTNKLCRATRGREGGREWGIRYLPPFRLPSIMAFARVRWQGVSFVFLSNIFHLFYVAHSFKESYQADLRGQPHQSKRFFVRTVPKHSLYCVLPAFSLSLSVTLLLFWNFVMTIFYGLQKSKASEIFCLGKVQST